MAQCRRSAHLARARGVDPSSIQRLFEMIIETFNNENDPFEPDACHKRIRNDYSIKINEHKITFQFWTIWYSFTWEYSLVFAKMELAFKFKLIQFSRINGHCKWSERCSIAICNHIHINGCWHSIMSSHDMNAIDAPNLFVQIFSISSRIASKWI